MQRFKVFEGRSRVASEFLKPIERLREDSGLPKPVWEDGVKEAVRKLPKLPFEKVVNAFLSGEVQEALPPLPFEPTGRG